MKYPEGTTHFGHRLDDSIIWYKKSVDNKFYYITDDEFKKGRTNWTKCLNRPSIPMMRIYE